MNKISEILEAHENLITAYENLAEAEKSVEEITQVMDDTAQAVAAIESLGAMPELMFVLNKDEALEQLCQKPIKYITKEVAIEGFKEGASKAWDAFVEAVKTVMAKISEFFGWLFKTVDYKAKKVLTEIKTIDWEREVETMTRDAFAKLGAAVKMLIDFVGEHLNTNIFEGNGPDRDGSMAMSQMASRSQGVLSYDSNSMRVSVNDDAQKFEKITLNDAKFTLSEIAAVCNGYIGHTKSFSRFSETMHNFSKTISASFMDWTLSQAETEAKMNGGKDSVGNTTEQIRLSRHLVMAAYRANMSGYSCLCTLGRVAARQIGAFYRCLGASTATN